MKGEEKKMGEWKSICKMISMNMVGGIITDYDRIILIVDLDRKMILNGV